MLFEFLAIHPSLLYLSTALFTKLYIYQSQSKQQCTQRINEEIMREREEEIRNIHKGMHTVNEIYKDLAHLVDNQQEGVDQIETQMEGAKNNTASGLKHIEKANEASTSQCVIS